LDDEFWKTLASLKFLGKNTLFEWKQLFLMRFLVTLIKKDFCGLQAVLELRKICFVFMGKVKQSLFFKKN